MLRATLALFYFIARAESFALRPASYLPKSIVHRSTSLKATVEEPLYEGLNHVGVIVSDTATAVSWYTSTLGFIDESHLRPALPYNGAFLRAGAQQVHLMELPNPDPITGRPEHGGRDRHAAFSIRKLAPLKARLDAKGVPYTMSKSGRAALFCRDEDGNAFEFMELPSDIP